MQKCIFIIANIYERSVQTLHDLFNRSQVDVTHNKLASFRFFVEFYKVLVLKKGDATSVLSCTND